MDEFSVIVKKEIKKQEMNVSQFAVKLGISPQYLYDIMARRNGCRWNETLIDSACKSLGLKLEVTKIKEEE